MSVYRTIGPLVQSSAEKYVRIIRLSSKYSVGHFLVHVVIILSKVESLMFSNQNKV